MTSVYFPKSDTINTTIYISKARRWFSIFNLSSIFLDIPLLIYVYRRGFATCLAFIVLSFIFGCVPEAEAILMMICALSFALIGEEWILRKQRRVLMVADLGDVFPTGVSES